MVAYSFKKRFVDPIRAGLGIHSLKVPEGYRCGPVLTLLPQEKRQTIRAVGKRRHARPGEIIQLYSGMRTKQCQKIGEARCVSIQEIVIAFGKKPHNSVITIDGAARYMADGLNRFARLDGFEDWAEMCRFWETEHGIEHPFHGLLIKWEPLT